MIADRIKDLRLWPLLLIFLVYGAVLGWLWLAGDAIRQQRVVLTLMASVAALLLMLFWFLFWSRLSMKQRLQGLAGIAVVVVAAGATFRVTGVTGDLVPILEFRWARQPLQVVISETASPVSAVDLAHRAEAAGLALRDFPQFLGLNRDGIVPGVPLSLDWEEDPPRLLWRREVGQGWSSFAVSDGVAVTQEQHGDNESVTAYSILDGSLLWVHRYPARYESTLAGVGPRATPTVDDSKVYAMGATGILHALDLSTGNVLWVVDTLAREGVENRVWGNSCSPLVTGDLVVVSVGGSGNSLVAYDRQTGEKVWGGGSDAAAYSSPQQRTVAGKEQILILNHSTVASHDPETGRLLWSHVWPSGQPNVSQPLLLPGDRLLVTTGYGVGSKLFQIRRQDQTWSVDLIWETPFLKTKFTNAIFYEGYLYGLDDGILSCVEAATGRRQWKRGRYGHGQLLLVGGLLLLTTEDGQVVLIQPNPRLLVEVTRFRAFDDKFWNPPVLAGDLLLVRTHKEAAAFRLPLNEALR